MECHMNDILINKALLFAAEYFNRSCHNSGKPVYLHCLRVAHRAFELGYGDSVIIGAVLHDLLEDTDCPLQAIEREFGLDTATIVAALSNNEAIPDKLTRNRDSIDRCAALGPTAIIIKCLDTADNAAFFPLASWIDQTYLIEKYRYLIDKGHNIIPDEPALHDLIEKTRQYFKANHNS